MTEQAHAQVAAEGKETATNTSTDRPTILAVDDEERVVQAFELWLEDDYDVVTATDGSEALEQMHGGIDLVLLDRHMPGLSGDDVLSELRDQDYDCQVAMVTAVDPDFDIVDMPFDHYVSKPVDAQELVEVTDRLLEIETYDDKLNELYTISQKIATLETEKPEPKLAENNRYQSLLDRRDALSAELDEISSSLDGGERDELFGLAKSTK